MRSNKNKKKLIIAVIAGIVATYFVFSMFNNQNKQIVELERKSDKKPAPVVISTQQPRMINVVTASKPIKAGTKLTQNLLKVEQRPSDKITPDSADNIVSLLDKRVSVDIEEGEIVSKTILTEEKPAALQIPVGMRAITIPTEFIQGLASYIRVGSRVDIISTAKDKEDKPEILIQNVKIISFESTVDVATNSITANKASAITLQVPAEKATSIVNAISGGKIQFIARNESDNKFLASNRNSWYGAKKYSGSKSIPNLNIKPLPLPPADKLFDNNSLPPPANPNIGVKSQKVELIQANVKSEVSFDGLN